MAEPAARLYLITPVLDDVAAFVPRLGEACGAGDVAAVLARLGPADERTLTNRVKVLAPLVQEAGAALVIEILGEGDRATISARGGADGAHATASVAAFRELRQRMKDDRILGAGGIRSKDDAMALGEAGADYLMFGEPRADGSLPSQEGVIERVAWWAEIFETPCVVYAPSLEALPALARTGAEFVALGDAVWEHPQGAAEAVRLALAALEAQRAAS